MFNKIRYHIFKWFRPSMIYGYKRNDGRRLASTRVSNTTFIGSPEKLNIDDNVYIGHFNFIDASNNLTIREGCQITNYVSVLTHSSHKSIRLYGKDYMPTSEHHGYDKGQVIIGAYSFIGPHSVIMPGTIIGKGSLVSAYSYVQGIFPDYAVIAGNPAKVIGDTRDMDKKYLEQFPELNQKYEEWDKRF